MNNHENQCFPIHNVQFDIYTVILERRRCGVAAVMFLWATAVHIFSYCTYTSYCVVCYVCLLPLLNFKCTKSACRTLTKQNQLSIYSVRRNAAPQLCGDRLLEKAAATATTTVPRCIFFLFSNQFSQFSQFSLIFFFFACRFWSSILVGTAATQ